MKKYSKFLCALFTFIVLLALVPVTSADALARPPHARRQSIYNNLASTMDLTTYLPANTVQGMNYTEYYITLRMHQSLDGVNVVNLGDDELAILSGAFWDPRTGTSNNFEVGLEQTAYGTRGEMLTAGAGSIQPTCLNGYSQMFLAKGCVGNYDGLLQDMNVGIEMLRVPITSPFVGYAWDVFLGPNDPNNSQYFTLIGEFFTPYSYTVNMALTGEVAYIGTSRPDYPLLISWLHPRAAFNSWPYVGSGVVPTNWTPGLWKSSTNDGTDPCSNYAFFYTGQLNFLNDPALWSVGDLSEGQLPVCSGLMDFSPIVQVNKALTKLFDWTHLGAVVHH